MSRRLASAVVAACAVAIPAAAADTYPNVDVLSVDARGHVTDLTPSPGLDTSPAPAPDGKRIAFISSRDGAPDIYVEPAAGGTPTRITTSPFDDETVAWNDAGKTSIAWSPNGRRIAFDVQNATYSSDCMTNCVVWSVYVANADGSDLRLVASSAKAPAWSRDGRLLAYENDITPYGESESVAIDRLDGSTPVRIPIFNAFSDFAPAWSPGRNELLFQASPSWVFTVRADGSARHRLARGLYPAWSPDGNSITYTLGTGLYRMSRAGTGIRRLVSGRGDLGFPAWSPGGRSIAYFAVPRHGSPAIEVVPAAGGRTHGLASAAGFDGNLAWLGRSGSLVYSRRCLPSCPS